jgi:hypothetical protein
VGRAAPEDRAQRKGLGYRVGLAGRAVLGCLAVPVDRKEQPFDQVLQCRRLLVGRVPDRREAIPLGRVGRLGRWPLAPAGRVV